MAAKDRTSDFVGITVLFDTGRGRPQTHRPLSRDARLAQQVSDQLRQQELCLRELQELVGRKSILGDDPSAQIATLTDVLKKELGAVERNIQAFQQTVAAQRGRHQQHHQAHFAIVCQSLKSRCAKSVKAFHQALQQHTAAIRERSTRRSKFSHGGGNPMITGMYTRMATMVAEQGEIISRIDDDMDIAQTNVEAAHGELLKLFNMVQGNRSLILKIFLVLILVIFLFVVVF
ncbi:Syntaxin 5 [Phytophthora cinnamomi]|uniref:Syntaxin 5 n=1 Tax=Phytophthora cinnamomi TaxID=4785 RepID=UPI003559D148|nr:Syntaxin 5 [Phytophthora cinnamomi]